MGANDGADETKAEIYEAIAVINRAFAQITSTLYKMESKGVLAEDYAYSQELPLKRDSSANQLLCAFQGQ